MGDIMGDDDEEEAVICSSIANTLAKHDLLADGLYTSTKLPLRIRLDTRKLDETPISDIISL
jgi:hypothetical protein